MKSININDYIEKYEKKKSRMLFFYSFLSLLFLMLTIMVLSISKRDYLPYLIINILITCLFGWFSVYFFTIKLKSINHTLLKYKKINNAKSEKIYSNFSYEKIDYIDEGKIYIYGFINENGEESKFYSLEKLILNKSTYLIESKLNYLIYIEEHYYE